MQLTGVLSIGLLLTLSFLDSDIKGGITNIKLVKKTKAFLLAWLLTTFAFILIQISYLLQQPLASSFDLTVIRSYLTQTAIGKSYIVQIIGIILLLSVALRRVITTYLSLLIALIAIVAPVFQSHGSSSGRHGLAIGALVIHVIALSFWVGGLFGLTQLSKEQKLIALPRFSELALWSAITVVITGAATAWTRLDSIEAWQSKYGAITLLKISLAVTLVGFGVLHRRWIIKSDFPSVFRLITAEIAIMFATVFVGSWLSTVAPPNRVVESTPAILITGIAMPEAPNLTRVLLAYDADGLMLALLIFAVALYIKGVLILSRRGVKWPIGRTLAFAIGISAVDFATSGGLGVYSRFAFSNHMMAHMVLGMIAPIGIVLGAPITLALRTLPQGRTEEERGVRGTLIALLHSKPAGIITNPVTILALFDGSLFALYMTPLFGNMMQSHLGHLVMTVHFLLAGILFFHVIIGIDPNPRKVPHIVRIVILFAAMSIHAFFAVALISTSTVIDQGYFASLQTPWNLDLLADQRAGGSIAWAMGELPILLALVATFIQWMRDDKRETKRIDRNEARMAAMGEPDELAQYNTYLNSLAMRDLEKDK